MATDVVHDWISRADPMASRRIEPWPIGRWLLIAAVLGWFALLILVPSMALLRQVWVGGMRPFFETLATPEVRRAFGLTLGITALATVVNTVFGIAIALVLVRQRFWGRALLDGVVDLPFAVSPVVAGLMLVVLYGPEGWLGRWLEHSGFRVIYAVPGMIVATLFVTLPVRGPRAGADFARAWRGARAGGLHARGRALADVLERDAAVDPLGRGLRRDADGRPVAGRIWRGAGGLRQPDRADPDRDAIHPRRDRELSHAREHMPPAWCWRQCRLFCWWEWMLIRKRLDAREGKRP